MKVLRKRVGAPLEIVETNEKWFLDCAKSFFEEGVHTERVYLEDYRLIMVVDEDGLLKDLPINFLMAMDHHLDPVQKIVGDVVIIRNKAIEHEGEIYDYEVDDICEADIARIDYMLEKTMAVLYPQSDAEAVDIGKELINLICEAKSADPELGSFTEFLAGYLLGKGVCIRKRSKWRLLNDGRGTCCNCGKLSNSVWSMRNGSAKFCKNCGAEMIGVEVEWY